jgi:hypothetical protein
MLLHLYLNGNSLLSNVGFNSDNLKQLQYILIAECFIWDFKHLKNSSDLVFINYSNNKIDYLNSNLFANTDKLKALDLSNIANKRFTSYWFIRQLNCVRIFEIKWKFTNH